jgi:hypothetical protein
MIVRFFQRLQVVWLRLQIAYCLSRLQRAQKENVRLKRKAGLL